MTRKPSGTAVVLGSMFLFFAVVVYIVQFGPRHPYSDDWVQVPYLVKASLDWEWLWAIHVDHRIPLPKLIQWVSFKIAGDYRTPSLIVAALFVVVTTFISVVSVRIRGRASVVDLVPALACFHFAQGFLGWGFYIQFGLSTFFLGLLCIWLASRIHREQQTWKNWDLVALLVILVALTASGTNGSIPALILAGYFTFRVAWQQRNVHDLSTLASLSIIAGLVAMCGLSLKTLFAISHGSFRATRISDAIEVALHVSISPIGAVVMDTRKLIGSFIPWLSLALIGFAFFLAIKPVWCYVSSFRRTEAQSSLMASQRPASRADFLVVGFAILSVVLAIGVGRGGRGWEPGLEMHYGAAALPLIFWSYLSLVLSWQDRYARIATGIFALILAWSYVLSIPMANWGGKFRNERRIAFEQDLRAGKSVDDIINENIGFLYWVDNSEGRRIIREGLLLLKAEAIRDHHRRPALQHYRSITDIGH